MMRAPIPPRLRLFLFFLLAYGLSWTLWAPLWLPAFGIDALPALSFQHSLGALGPIAAAVVMTVLESGRTGLKALFSRMGLWRGRLSWVLIAFLGPFVVFGLALVLVGMRAEEPLSFSSAKRPIEILQEGGGLFLYNLVVFGYGEETGWRGYALPHFQAHHSAFVSTLLLTVGWAGWHAPLFVYRPGYAGMGVAEIMGWSLSLLTGALLLTWLYNSSRGSLLVVALFHASINVVFLSDLSGEAVLPWIGAFITLWSIGILLWAGPRTLSRTGALVRSGDAERPSP